jgi:hypothetical protein
MELGKGNDRPFRCTVSEAGLWLARLGIDRGSAWGRHALPSRDPKDARPPGAADVRVREEDEKVSSESANIEAICRNFQKVTTPPLSARHHLPAFGRAVVLVDREWPIGGGTHE